MNSYECAIDIVDCEAPGTVKDCDEIQCRVSARLCSDGIVDVLKGNCHKLRVTDASEVLFPDSYQGYTTLQPTMQVGGQINSKVV